MKPDYIFESSWEVCNKVGGIYAVLSTRAASMQKKWKDQVIFIGPDFGTHSDLFFEENATLWKKLSLAPELSALPQARIGRWNIPGKPIAILIHWNHLWEQKNTIYGWAWDRFGVKSHAAYGDYDDSCLFGYAAGQMVETITQTITKTQTRLNIVAHANEWQTAFMLFYLRDKCPQVRTLFTTHATGIGRSIAGNGKPLYDYFEGYHGDQMADELGMVSKHSAEKQAAWVADCFTTVSDITARECKQLLDKPVDIVTPNGFEQGFVPKGATYTEKRAAARRILHQWAEKYLRENIEDDACYLCISGRQEWKNKGIDVFLDSMRRLGALRLEQRAKKHVIAFVLVPYLEHPVIRIGKTSVIFLPYYLDGSHPIFHVTYYDVLIGMDLSIFPSYYEPWGYTPLESVAFGVPTITTSLSGFGDWYKQQPDTKAVKSIKPVTVVERNDSNYGQVVNDIVDTILTFFSLDTKQTATLRKAAIAVGKQADWEHFFPYYEQAYDIALSKRL
ncbi:MAG: glycogen/starch synthase [Paludibacteraceae bacterium]|nr:glycogen/starch synthase [Paludibacteraceae bacterium]